MTKFEIAADAQICKGSPVSSTVEGMSKVFKPSLGSNPPVLKVTGIKVDIGRPALVCVTLTTPCMDLKDLCYGEQQCYAVVFAGSCCMRVPIPLE